MPIIMVQTNRNMLSVPSNVRVVHVFGKQGADETDDLGAEPHGHDQTEVYAHALQNS